MSPRRPPTLRQEQQAATRQRLLDAARESFVKTGFISTTVDEIAEAAGTSRATFYLHFKSKVDALAHTWQEVDLPEVDALFREFDRGADFTWAATRLWVDRMVTYWENHGRIALTANQALSLEPELAEDWLQGMTRVANDMPNLQAKLGGDDESVTRILVRVIQMERTLYFWTNTAFPYSREHLVSSLTSEWAVDDAH
ncbi:TetR/AcrR family transcriptional regulator [Diaminobutyricibacter sp. McL0618]|uniref:TetR/AcrR family transcriptional regulator n=1 Tax=Leifsonia sp. McL0618 TaxID=3415677 RepID=UPI003CE8D306